MLQMTIKNQTLKINKLSYGEDKPSSYKGLHHLPLWEYVRNEDKSQYVSSHDNNGNNTNSPDINTFWFLCIGCEGWLMDRIT
jgi:hypothetical protein